MGAGFPLQVMEMFWNKKEVMVTQHRGCTKYHRNVHIKMFTFLLCEFQLYEKNVIKKTTENLWSRDGRETWRMMCRKQVVCNISQFVSFGQRTVVPQHR